MGLQIETDEANRSLRVTGELDLASASELSAALAPLVAEPGDVTIDVSELSFIDSSGVHALTKGAEALADRGAIRLVHPSAPVRSVLDMTGLSEQFLGEGTEAT
jgi:anti-sigma B factor antagonist